MPATLPTTSSPHCSYSLDQIDTLHDHAHRILLYGNLVASTLDGYAVEDQTLEGLCELVTEMITHAKALEDVLERGGREKGGV